MSLEKYQIDQFNQDALKEHQRKFEFVSSSIDNTEEFYKS